MRAASVPDGLLTRLVAGTPPELSPLTHIEHLPARDAVYADWPAWVSDALVERLRERGIERPWAHQAQAASLAHGGAAVVVATGTASGKSLAYQLPALCALLD
ncbi:MAG: DEAD/DEAH box helicase, partial [Trebonia sp.]